MISDIGTLLARRNELLGSKPSRSGAIQANHLELVRWYCAHMSALRGAPPHTDTVTINDVAHVARMLEVVVVAISMIAQQSSGPRNPRYVLEAITRHREANLPFGDITVLQVAGLCAMDMGASSAIGDNSVCGRDDYDQMLCAEDFGLHSYLMASLRAIAHVLLGDHPPK